METLHGSRKYRGIGLASLQNPVRKQVDIFNSLPQIEYENSFGKSHGGWSNALNILITTL